MKQNHIDTISIGAYNDHKMTVTTRREVASFPILRFGGAIISETGGVRAMQPKGKLFSMMSRENVPLEVFWYYAKNSSQNYIKVENVE